MSKDIFEFWAEASPSDKTHPRDRRVLDRLDHDFKTQCLPTCFTGPLRTAPVVLLFLSPGLSEDDLNEADTPMAQERYAICRKGYQPLWGPEDHPAAWKWWSARISVFGALPELRNKIAILNICAYHSKTFDYWHMLSALPSCRVTLDWAQDVLFPQAEEGKRVVICMRSAAQWGLGKQGRYGKSLFVPAVTRNGHIRHRGESTASRDEVVAAVKTAVASTTPQIS